MAETFDEKGVITDTSNDFSVVSLTINGELRSFLFSKTIFYTFGVQCEGSMRNILEEGMDVELCYKISHPGDKARLVAVWLGDKPDIVAEDKTTLSALYERNGHILGPVGDGKFLVQDEDNLAVLISKDVVFQDGAPLKGNLDADEEIVFDAVPLEFEQDLGASYEATCAWIGPKPKVVDRFGLRLVDCDAGFSGEKIVEGTVAVIPNDVVALVDVVFKSMLIKVLLFRSSFDESCERIQDAVVVGDSLCLRLGYGSIFCGRRQWYALRAFKRSVEVNRNQDVNASKERLFELAHSTENIQCSGSNPPGKPCFEKNSKVLFPPVSSIISRLPNCNEAFISYGNCKVLVSREDFYVAGKQCTLDDFVNYVAPGTNIAYFEAILAESSCADGAGFTHKALCAWVGKNKKPSVAAIAATLPPANLSLLNERDKVFYGIVQKFRLPNIAFLDIPGKSTTVIAHLSDFVSSPKYPPENDSDKIMITHYLGLKDYVQFKVRENLKVPTLLQTCEVQPALFTEETWNKLKAGARAARVFDENKPPREKIVSCNTTEETPSKTKPFTNCGSVSVNSLHVPPARSPPPLPGPSAQIQVSSRYQVGRLALIKKMHLSPSRGYFINCEGILRVESVGTSVVVKIQHMFGTSSVEDSSSFFSADIPSDSKGILKFANHALRFDACFAMSPEANRDFREVRLWKPGADRLDIKHLLRREIEEVSAYVHGEITSMTISFHDTAVVFVENLRIVVTLDSLRTEEEINPNTSSIETYLNVGDRVFVRYGKSKAEDLNLAHDVLSLRGNPNIIDIKPRMTFPSRVMTWTHVWGFGEVFRKEPIVRKDGRYVVEFVSSKRPDMALSLNLFQGGRVFINGINLETPEMLADYVGSEITFHARHKDFEDTAGSLKGMRIACAWIGTEPSAKYTLKEALAVPKNSVRATWRYEAVVSSFPLPSYAVCYVGWVPVVVRICNQNQEQVLPFMPKVGDRIVISAAEEHFGDAAVVYSNDLKNLKRSSEVAVKDVFKNMTGTVVALPEPVGKIKAAGADFEVNFELCHVLCSDVSTNWRDWGATVREKIAIGKQVRFSAMKYSKKIPYRAFEVYLIE